MICNFNASFCAWYSFSHSNRVPRNILLYLGICFLFRPWLHVEYAQRWLSCILLNSLTKCISGYLQYCFIFLRVCIPRAVRRNCPKPVDGSLKQSCCLYNASVYGMVDFPPQLQAWLRQIDFGLPRLITEQINNERHAHLRRWLHLHTRESLERYGSLLHRSLVQLDTILFCD